MKKEKLWQTSMDFFAPTCHQKSERSFFIHGWQFPICARCTGLYLGYIIGIMMLLQDLYVSIWICFLSLFLMLLDWFLQYKNIMMSNNLRRFLSGGFAGIAIVQLLGYVWRMIL